MILCPLPLRAFRITQRFGENASYYAKYGHKGHNGFDLAPKYPWSDRTIYAPHDGYVRIVYGDPGYGNFINLQSLPREAGGKGQRSDLAHLAQFMVKDGQFVTMGEPIGIMGSTGDSTGVHLHWAYKQTKNGQTINETNGYGGAIDISRFVVHWTTPAGL